MKQTLQKIVHSLMTISTVLALSGIGMASSAQAGQIQVASVTLGDSRSAANTQHIIQFNVASASYINHIKFEYVNHASNGITPPPNLVTTAAAKVSVTMASVDDTNQWTLDNTGGGAGNGTLLYNRAVTGYNLAAGDTVNIVTTTITNNSTSGAGTCDAVVDSDSCWIRIKTYNDATLVDQTAINYTVINPITVTSTVDPILTFTVTGQVSASIAGNDANAGAGTATDSTSTALTFGNLTVGTPKLSQQGLQVLTNANTGYEVSSKFVGAFPMVGTYGGNHIVPFVGTGAASWAAPQVWISPTGGSNNNNAAWIGIRTTDCTGGGNLCNAANFYAAPVVNANTTLGTNIVMKKASPDNGSVTKYVTFKIEANAFQASDYYTGTMVYNVVSTY